MDHVQALKRDLFRAPPERTLPRLAPPLDEFGEWRRPRPAVGRFEESP